MTPRAARTLAGVALMAALAGVATSGVARPHGHRRRSAAISRPAGVRHRSPSRLATFGHGSWCWFADPRAVHLVGRYDQTIVGWIDWHGAVTVGAYDSRFGVMQKHVVGRLFHDDHGSPSILVEPDHRLTVFWSGHNGGAMYYRTTLRPEDISAWGARGRIHSRLRGHLGFTYPNPVILPAENNRLYLFWRGAQWGQDYITRSISGRWSSAHELISAPGQRPYVKVDSDAQSKIAFAFTNGHPREGRTSVYYAAYQGGWLLNARGRRIAPMGRPIRPRQASLVYDGRAQGASAWVWDVALDHAGRPVIVYATFQSTSNHRYWYAHWNGQRWVTHFVTFAGPTISPGTIEHQYSGGMALDHSDPSILYLSRRVAGRFEIERWVTPDGGARWTHVVVVRTPGTGDVRPVVPRNAGPGSIELLWLRGPYRSYTGYRTWIEFAR